MEYYNFINPIQKLRTEDRFHLIHHVLLHPLIIPCRIFFGGKSQFLRLYNCFCTRIGCHNDYRIAEIYFPPLGICNMAVIQHLEKYVKYIRMRFLHFIK